MNKLTSRRYWSQTIILLQKEVTLQQAGGGRTGGTTLANTGGYTVAAGCFGTVSSAGGRTVLGCTRTETGTTPGSILRTGTTGGATVSTVGTAT